MLKTIVLKHTVPKKKEGTYYTLEFNVPQNIERITVSYRYPGKQKGTKYKPAANIIDLGLIDADEKFLGWSGSAHKKIFIGAYASSAGYLAKPIKPGCWHILIGAYKVRAEGADVEFEITFEEKSKKWIFGDLHSHSTASDGKLDIYQLGKMAKKKGLDFIAVSNHNNYAENLALPHKSGLTFIPAVEWTHYKGHMNLFGPTNPFENSFVANSEDEMKAVINKAKELGALVSVNHPKCSFCPYLWDDENGFDIIEIWNGPMRAANMRAIAWWTELLKKGRRLPAVGGSDFHRRHRFVSLGNPVTAVSADSASVKDILTALSSGHAYVTFCVKGPRLELQYNEAGMGDSIRLQENCLLEITASRLRGTQLILVTEKGEKTLAGYSKGGALYAAVKPEGPGFAYVKAVRHALGHEIIRAVSNPIYFE